MERRQPDIGRVSGLLGWEPEQSMDRIIDDVVEYCRAKSQPQAGAGSPAANTAWEAAWRKSFRVNNVTSEKRPASCSILFRRGSIAAPANLDAWF